jgi:hypothetical protein
MLRWLFNILSAASFALCVLMVIHHLTYRSFRIVGPPIWFSHSWATIIATGDNSYERGMRGECPPLSVAYEFGDGSLFGMWKEPGEKRLRWCLRIPDTSALPFLMIAPAIWCVHHVAIRFRRLQWQRSGRCRTCGYDLRASLERCPECGTLAFAPK